MTRIAQLTDEESEIIDVVRRVTSGIEKTSYLQKQAAMYGDLEDVLNTLTEAVHISQGDPDIDPQLFTLIEDARTSVYRLLR